MVAPLNSIFFRSFNLSTFNAVRFDDNPLTCQSEKEDKKAEGFQILHCYWSFSSDILAVKGLIDTPLSTADTFLKFFFKSPTSV